MTGFQLQIFGVGSNHCAKHNHCQHFILKLRFLHKTKLIDFLLSQQMFPVLLLLSLQMSSFEFLRSSLGQM